MAAHLLHQASDLRAAFAARVRNKTVAERDALGQRVEERLARWPKPLRSVMRWGAQQMWDGQGRQHARHGLRGERQLTMALRWRLSPDWWLLPDVLLSADGDRLSQIDLVGVGPPGLFVVEVKRWTGAIRATGDRWVRKEGARWISCESPTRQNTAHVRNIRAWWQAVELDNLVGPILVQPVVVVLETAWLRVSTPTMPVFDRPSAVARYLQRPLTAWRPEQVEAVAHMLAERSGPYKRRVLTPTTDNV